MGHIVTLKALDIIKSGKYLTFLLLRHISDSVTQPSTCNLQPSLIIIACDKTQCQSKPDYILKESQGDVYQAIALGDRDVYVDHRQPDTIPHPTSGWHAVTDSGGR